MNMNVVVVPVCWRPRVRNGALVALNQQRGASLFIALVALVLMTIIGLSLMRSVDTGNVIAGNMAFRQLTVNAADLGVEAAADYLNATVAPAPDGNFPEGCVVASRATNTRGTCRYTARSSESDDKGIPFVDWSSRNIPSASVNGVTFQYMIDRLCNPDFSVPVDLGADASYSEAERRCVTAVFSEGESASSGRHAYKDAGGLTRITPIHYRVTVRVQGPRKTVAFVQALLAR